MQKKKPKPPAHPPSLGDLSTKDLLRSIRADLDEEAKRAGLARSEPLKPKKSR